MSPTSTTFTFSVTIHQKQKILHPPSNAITTILKRLGFENIANLRQGKHIIIELQENDPQRARRDIENMCATLLVNHLIEEYHIELQPPCESL